MADAGRQPGGQVQIDHAQGWLDASHVQPGSQIATEQFGPSSRLMGDLDTGQCLSQLQAPTQQARVWLQSLTALTLTQSAGHPLRSTGPLTKKKLHALGSVTERLFSFFLQIIHVRLGNLLQLITLGNQVSDVENFHMV